MKTAFSRLKYPKHLVNSIIKSFVDSKVFDQQRPLSPAKETEDTVRVVLPCKDQISADIVKEQLKDLNQKVNPTIQPVFASRKIEQELNVKEAKPPIVNEQCVVNKTVYNFQCDLCAAGYVHVRNTRGHLHNRVKGHKQQSSAIAKHYKNVHEYEMHDFAFHKNLKTKSQRAIRIYSCESIFIICAPCYVNFCATSL